MRSVRLKGGAFALKAERLPQMRIKHSKLKIKCSKLQINHSKLQIKHIELQIKHSKLKILKGKSVGVLKITYGHRKKEVKKEIGRKRDTEIWRYE